VEEASASVLSSGLHRESRQSARGALTLGTLRAIGIASIWKRVAFLTDHGIDMSLIAGISCASPSLHLRAVPSENVSSIFLAQELLQSFESSGD
jgi:hypothetical protein